MAVAVFVAVTGCGEPPRMTIEEYGRACEGLEAAADRFNLQLAADSDLVLAFRDFEGTLAEARGWNPPEEFAEFHEALVTMMDFLLESLWDTGWVVTMQEVQQAAQDDDRAKLEGLQPTIDALEEAMAERDDEFDQLEQEMERAHEGLGPTAQRVLGDCFP